MAGKSKRVIIREVVVKPKKGKNTRLQNYKKLVKGQPDMKPSEPRVTKTKGDILRISPTKKVGKYSVNGDILGADGRFYYYVTKHSENGKAAKLYVKASDVEIFRFGELYTVKKGDSLSKIAKKEYGPKLVKVYGSGRLVQTIYEVNKQVIGKNKNLIYPGQKLLIPFPGR